MRYNTCNYLGWYERVREQLMKRKIPFTKDRDLATLASWVTHEAQWKDILYGEKTDKRYFSDIFAGIDDIDEKNDSDLRDFLRKHFKTDHGEYVVLSKDDICVEKIFWTETFEFGVRYVKTMKIKKDSDGTQHKIPVYATEKIQKHVQFCRLELRPTKEALS